jgi:hypothetical protein
MILLFLLIIILISLLSYDRSGSNDLTYRLDFNKFVVENKPNPKNFEISKAFFFRKFLVRVEKFYLNDFLNQGRHRLKFLDSFVSLLYEHHCELDFNKLDFFKLEFEFYFRRFKHIISTNFSLETSFERLKDFLEKKYKKIEKRAKRHSINYTGKVPTKFNILAYMQYDNLEYISMNNQSTMRYKSEMKLLNKLGFIEMFASPFNRSLDYYCSLFKNDKNFGALGTYEELIDYFHYNPSLFVEDFLKKKSDRKDKILKLCISVVSGFYIQKTVVEKLLQILKLRPVIISSNWSKQDNLFGLLLKTPFIHDFKMCDLSYDPVRMIYNDMYKLPWLSIILSNHKQFKLNPPYIDKLLYFPEESPYEIPKLMERKKKEYLKLFGHKF